MGGKTGHVMTLANSIIGVGILAMPFCFQKCGIVLSILLLILSNFISRISCHYLMKSSILTRRKNIEFLAFYAFGTSGKLMVELCTIGYLIGTCIAYFVVVGDLGPQIAAKLFDLNMTSALRTWVMVIVTLFCVIPLGLLRNVDSLSTVCTASIGFYFCLVTKVMAESKVHIASGDWWDHVDFWKPSGVLQCLPIFGMALSCQMQLFEVFDSVSNSSLEKMNDIVKSSTLICTIVYIFVGFFGYVAFCTMSFSGNILVNFTPSITSDVIKIGFVLSVAFSFPLVIFPCRASLYSLLYRRGHSDAAHYIPENRFRPLTVSIVIFSLIISLLIPSIEVVIGLVGSTIGVAICIMFPAACFIKVSKKESTEKILAQLILIFGFCLMTFGTYANLNAIDIAQSEVHIQQEEVKVALPLQPEFNVVKNGEGGLLPISDREDAIMNLSDSVRDIINQLPQVNEDAMNLVPKIPGHRAKAMDITLEERLKELTNNADKLNHEAIHKEELEILEKQQDKPLSSKENKEILNIQQDRLLEVVQEVQAAQDELKRGKDKLSGDLAKDIHNEDVQNIINGQISIVGDIQHRLEHIDELLENPNVLQNHMPDTVDDLKAINSEDTSYVDILPDFPKDEVKLNPPPSSPVLKMLLKNVNNVTKNMENVAVVPASYKVGEVINNKEITPIPVRDGNLIKENAVPDEKTIVQDKPVVKSENGEVDKNPQVVLVKRMENKAELNLGVVKTVEEKLPVLPHESKLVLKEPIVPSSKTEIDANMFKEKKDEHDHLKAIEVERKPKSIVQVAGPSFKDQENVEKVKEQKIKQQEEIEEKEEKENIEAIRRDLLGADKLQEEVTTFNDIKPPSSLDHNREKREAEEFCEKNKKMLLFPKTIVDSHIESDVGLNTVDAQKSLLSELQVAESKIMGRDLKSVKEVETLDSS